MREWFVGIALVMAAPCGLLAQGSEQMQVHTYQQIGADQLKSWYDDARPMVVVDARKKENFNHVTLPGAVWVPYTSSDREIQTAIPTDHGAIVVYCCDRECAASRILAERLEKLGYFNIYEFPEGLKGWQARGYTITKQ